MNSNRPAPARSPFAAMGDVFERLAGLPAVVERLELSLRDGAIPEKRLLTVPETATILGLSERSVRDLIKSGDLPTRDIQSMRVTRIALRDLDAWIENLPRKEPTHE